MACDIFNIACDEGMLYLYFSSLSLTTFFFFFLKFTRRIISYHPKLITRVKKL